MTTTTAHPAPYPTINFGEHLTLDGYLGSKPLLNDEAALRRFLADLPEQLGMHKICEPQIVHTEGNGGNDPGGLSGFVMIAESHISIHTFVERRFASADIYTCKNGMDIEFIVNWFKQTFDFQDVEQHLIQRGRRYPATNID